jgi:hypothetical protein
VQCHGVFFKEASWPTVTLVLCIDVDKSYCHHLSIQILHFKFEWKIKNKMMLERNIELKFGPLARHIDSAETCYKAHKGECDNLLFTLKKSIEQDLNHWVELKPTGRCPMEYRVHEPRKDNQPSAFGLIHAVIEGGYLFYRFSTISRLSRKDVSCEFSE